MRNSKLIMRTIGNLHYYHKLYFGMLTFHFPILRTESYHPMAKGELRNAIGGAVQKHRYLQNLTQSDLAVRCNLVGFDIGRESVSQIERGTRGVSDLEMILLSLALKIDINELIPATLPKWKKDLRPPKAFE